MARIGKLPVVPADKILIINSYYRNFIKQWFTCLCDGNNLKNE